MKNLSKLFVLIIFLYMHSTAYAYDIKTHEQFNKEVSAFKDTQFGLNFDEFLVNYVSFKSGINTEVHFYSEKMKIQEWIGYGGKREDELYPASALRVLHHFHNPLSETVDIDTAVKSWKEAGLGLVTYKDLGLNISGGCFGTSAAIAAQTQENSQCEISSYEGDWSWKIARKFYYTALTGDSTTLDGFTVKGEAESFFSLLTEIVKKMIGIGGYPIKGQTGLKEDEKKVYWARTFRAVGQVMHLVHDQAVPAHVRNDRHLPLDYDTYEKTVDKKLHGKKPNASWQGIANQSISNPIVFEKSILSQSLWGSPGGQSSNSSVTIPIGWIFDSNH